MSKITLTNDDGSEVVFLDPAGVQAAVDEAVAGAAPAGPTVTPTDTGVTITHEDGTVQTFVPAPEAPAEEVAAEPEAA